MPSLFDAVVKTTNISKALQATWGGLSDGAGTVWSQFGTVGRWTFLQNFSSLGLTVWEWRCSEDWEERVTASTGLLITLLVRRLDNIHGCVCWHQQTNDKWYSTYITLYQTIVFTLQWCIDVTFVYTFTPLFAETFTENCTQFFYCPTWRVIWKGG